MLAEVFATMANGLFTGAALYVSLVEHPARVSCGVEAALTEFAPSYKRGALMQALLASIGFLSSLAAWITGADLAWPLVGALLFTVVPFTILAIMPTNKLLLAPGTAGDADAAVRLLRRWGSLHAVRTLVSAVSFVLFLVLLAQRA